MSALAMRALDDVEPYAAEAKDADIARQLHGEAGGKCLSIKPGTAHTLTPKPYSVRYRKYGATRELLGTLSGKSLVEVEKLTEYCNSMQTELSLGSPVK
jgi:hypothetical protein